jgi:uncharacterized protein (UPF0276 family)
MTGLFSRSFLFRAKMITSSSKNSLQGVGLGLKAQHYQTILETKPHIDWFEVHPENYMGEGGLPHYYLSQIHEHYPLSMHGVGLSLGSAEGIDKEHLQSLKKVVSKHQPAMVSEHLAWSHANSIFLNDLLPVPYTDEFLKIVVNNIHRVQDTLKRKILIENPSIYLAFENNRFTETEFLAELVKQTECELLLDINNVYVSAHNLNYDCQDYINHYPLEHVAEIHLAGHAQNHIQEENTIILIDDHGSPVIDEVWDLFSYTQNKIDKNIPVLIEWDTNIPDFEILYKEAEKAQSFIVDRNSKVNVNIEVKQGTY